MATTTAGEDQKQLSSSYRQGSLDEESLRRRTASSPVSSRSDTDDFINIEDNDPVAQALKQCETWVLTPYRVVLRILGWTQFTRDGDSRFLLILRMILVAVWTLVIITTFLTQILCCFTRDRFTPGNLTIITPITNDDILNDSNATAKREITCSDHVISSFVFFDLLLLFTYWFGLYLFSRGETEYLSNLAEKVFIKQSTIKKSMSSNRNMIITILAYLVVGFLWIVMSFAVCLMTARTVRLFESATVIRWSDDTI
jgi:hypothetical protein